MRIGIYSDLHVSRTSSILPLHTNDGKYTARLQMILNTGKWMYEQFSRNSVDLIVNCGDTLDSSTVKAEELTAISEFYSYSRGIPEIHLLGNHELQDNGHQFYSSAILNNIKNIKVISEPTVDTENNLVFVPYNKPDEVLSREISNMSGDIMFSHIDLKGSTLRGSYVLDTGFNPDVISKNVNMVINGHLHTAEKLNTTKPVWNIGSVSSVSFSDNSKYIPSICILDTESHKITRLENPHAILFRKITIKSVSDITRYLSSNVYKLALSVTAPYNIVDAVKDIISKEENVIASRVISDTSRIIDKVRETRQDIELSSNIEQEFIKFLKIQDKNRIASIKEYEEALAISRGV